MIQKHLATIVVRAAVVLAALVFTAPRPALAALDCDAMVMPVSQLKYVGRGYARYHAGIDLMAPYGSPVLAAAAGTVIYAARYYAYGNIIDIRHDDGTVTRYAHLSRYAAKVRPGAVVAAGEEIGAIGTSGNAHGAHLHFEVRIDGRAIDPKPLIMQASCQHLPRPERPLDAQVSTPGMSSATFVDARPGGIFQ